HGLTQGIDIRNVRNRPAVASRAEFLPQRLQRFRFQIDGRNSSAFGRKHLREPPTNPAAGAGDENNLVGKRGHDLPKPHPNPNPNPESSCLSFRSSSVPMQRASRQSEAAAFAPRRAASLPNV